MDSAPPYTNIYGRHGGRGWRPYLLLPKVICVAIALGGTVTLLALLFLQPAPGALAGWLEQARLIRTAYVWVIVPALLGALLLGAGLLLHHGRVLLRMRWLKAKLLLVVVCVPVLHLFMRSRSLAFQAALRDPVDLAAAASLRHQLLGGTVGVVVFLLVALILGRLKPRLGQSYARAGQQQTTDN